MARSPEATLALVWALGVSLAGPSVGRGAQGRAVTGWRRAHGDLGAGRSAAIYPVVVVTGSRTRVEIHPMAPPGWMNVMVQTPDLGTQD